MALVRFSVRHWRPLSRSRRVDLGTLNISAARWILDVYYFKADIASRILPSCHTGFPNI